MKKYVCTVCGYVYDPEENNAVEFENLPDDYTCPLCGVGKDMFEADNITVKVKYINDDVVVYAKLPDEQFSKTFAGNDVEGYEKYLRKLALCYVDFNTAYVKSYLEDRLNYQ